MDLNYGTVIKTKDGRYYSKVTNNDNDAGGRIMIQMDNVTLVNEDIIEFSDEYNTSKIVNIDTANKESALKNSNEWFSKLLSEKHINSAYVQSITDGTMNISKATVGKKVVTRVFDHKHTELTTDGLVDNIVCDVVLEFSGLWFMRNSFGPIWRLAQVRLPRPKKNIYPDQCLFMPCDGGEQDDEDEDDDDFV